MTKVRVRYAPSPTGHLHIGNARTALFNYFLPATMTENLSFVSRIPTKTEHRRRREKSVGKLSMVRDGMG